MGLHFSVHVALWLDQANVTASYASESNQLRRHATLVIWNCSVQTNWQAVSILPARVPPYVNWSREMKLTGRLFGHWLASSDYQQAHNCWVDYLCRVPLAYLAIHVLFEKNRMNFLKGEKLNWKNRKLTIWRDRAIHFRRCKRLKITFTRFSWIGRRHTGMMFWVIMVVAFLFNCRQRFFGNGSKGGS